MLCAPRRARPPHHAPEAGGPGTGTPKGPPPASLAGHRQVLVTNHCATQLQGQGSRPSVTSKESTKPQPDLHTVCRPEDKPPSGPEAEDRTAASPRCPDPTCAHSFQHSPSPHPPPSFHGRTTPSFVLPNPWRKGASLAAQTVKNPSAMQETRVRSPGWEGPPGKGMATHSSIPAWRIPWTEEPGGLQSMGSQRAGHD